VDGAIAGKLSRAELASLERALLAFWRRCLDLEHADPPLAMEMLRAHAEAGPLLEQLEIWLHRPDSAGKVDPVALLKPYQHIPAEALENVGWAESSRHTAAHSPQRKQGQTTG